MDLAHLLAVRRLALAQVAVALQEGAAVLGFAWSFYVDCMYEVIE